jgi:hypothetical protein
VKAPTIDDRGGIVGNGNEDADDGSPISCVPVDLGPSRGPRVARERGQTVTTLCFGRDEILNWPRYAVGKAAGVASWARLSIYRIGQPRGQQFLPIGQSELGDYYAVLGREPDRANQDTWGSSERFTVRVCQLQDIPRAEGVASEGARRIHFDRDNGPTWEFTVWGLPQSQNMWRRMLKRTAMGFPVEHLMAGNFRTIFLDMVVGGTLGVVNDETGNAARTSQRQQIRTIHVADGGAQMRETADPRARNVVCISYAAMNRPWWDTQSRPLPGAEADIDSAYSPQTVADTMYHECGHLLDFYNATTARGATAEAQAESRRLRPIRSDHEANGLWDRYRAVVYGAGVSQGPGEGLAEAYRVRLKGITHLAATRRARENQRRRRQQERRRAGDRTPEPPTEQAVLDADAEIAAAVGRAFDAAGMPSADSCRDAQAAIDAFVRDQGWTGGQGESWV